MPVTYGEVESLLFGPDGNALSLAAGTAIASGTGGLPVMGKDGSGNAQFIKTDTTGIVTISGTVTNASIGANGSAIPTSSTQFGGSDGTNLQAVRVYNTNTGGSEYTLGATLRASGATGSVETGTSGHPLRVDPTGTTTQPISAVSLPLPTGASTDATLAGVLTTTAFQARINTLGQKTGANSTPVVIASDQSAITITGTVTANIGTSPDIGANGSAAPSSSNQIGGSDGTNLQAVRVYNTNTGGSEWTLGAVLRASGATGSVETGTSTHPLRTDPTGTTTQPVSGTVTANQGTAAATASAWPTKVTDGTNTAAVKAASTAAVAADPALVVAISPNNPITTTPTTSSTATTSSVASSASSVTLLASNASRKGATFYNESTKTLYLKLGATASLTDYTSQLPPGSFFEMPFNYTGRVDGIWNTANGFARVTELT